MAAMACSTLLAGLAWSGADRRMAAGTLIVFGSGGFFCVFLIAAAALSGVWPLCRLLGPDKAPLRLWDARVERPSSPWLSFEALTPGCVSPPLPDAPWFQWSGRWSWCFRAGRVRPGSVCSPLLHRRIATSASAPPPACGSTPAARARLFLSHALSAGPLDHPAFTSISRELNLHTELPHRYPVVPAPWNCLLRRCAGGARWPVVTADPACFCPTSCLRVNGVPAPNS